VLTRGGLLVGADAGDRKFEMLERIHGGYAFEQSMDQESDHDQKFEMSEIDLGTGQELVKIEILASHEKGCEPLDAMG
jgi:hypothetical protein